MPPALLSHASVSATKDKPRQMDDVAKRRSDPTLYPTHGDAIAPKEKAPKKQSLGYVWRSGLAGGLAGCAVCRNHLDAQKAY
jgi:solute carrier family 25 (mitochondrial carrier protein), member 16